MQFLADVELICEDCKGTRYKPQILDVRYKGKNIHEVLNLTVRESLQYFAGHPKITDKMRVLEEVGLGYLRLGQSATTLSGGEAQRMKLAAHLVPTGRAQGFDPATPEEKEQRKRARAGKGALYIFDEPTTGLHFDDVSKLLAAFRKLIDAGGSVLCIEHNLDVIKVADWCIDLGPEGGSRGGQIVVAGPAGNRGKIQKFPHRKVAGAHLKERELWIQWASLNPSRRRCWRLVPCSLPRTLKRAQRINRISKHRAEDDRAADALKEAESLLQRQQYSQAEEKLHALIATQAENPQAWFDLGFAQSHLGKTAEAISAYKKATQLSPKWFEAQQNLGLALAKSGDLTAAAAALKIGSHSQADHRRPASSCRSVALAGAGN